MVFVFDLDDTICDTDGYSEKYILNFIKEHNLPYKQIASAVRFADDKFDWSEEEAIAWYKVYGDEMMENFPCRPGSVEFIKRLHDLGHKIVIATARATDWHTDPEGATLRWLEKNNIVYDKIYIGRCDKEKICEDENADIFIDDDIKITTKVSEFFAGKNKKQTFLFTTPYNKNLSVSVGVERVKDFEDFAKKLQNYI